MCFSVSFCCKYPWNIPKTCKTELPMKQQQFWTLNRVSCCFINLIKPKHCAHSNCLSGSGSITVLICILLVQESKCFLFVSDKTCHIKCGINRGIKAQEHIEATKQEHTLNIYKNISFLINDIPCVFVNNDMNKFRMGLWYKLLLYSGHYHCNIYKIWAASKVSGFNKHTSCRCLGLPLS